MSLPLTVRFGVKWTGTDKQMGTVVLSDVTASEAITLRRVMERNGCTTFEATAPTVLDVDAVVTEAIREGGDE